MKVQPSLIAVLVTREHSRLMSQVKALEGLVGEPYSASKTSRLRKMAERWRHTLCFDDGVAPLVAALDTFIDAYEKQSPDLEKDHDELTFAAGVYAPVTMSLSPHRIPLLLILSSMALVGCGTIPTGEDCRGLRPRSDEGGLRPRSDSPSVIASHGRSNLRTATAYGLAVTRVAFGLAVTHPPSLRAMGEAISGLPRPSASQ